MARLRNAFMYEVRHGCSFDNVTVNVSQKTRLDSAAGISDASRINGMASAHVTCSLMHDCIAFRSVLYTILSTGRFGKLFIILNDILANTNEKISHCCAVMLCESVWSFSLWNKIVKR